MSKTRRRSKPVRASVVINGHTLNPGQEQVWRVANEDVGSGELGRIKRGLLALRRLEREFHLQASARAVRDGLAESVALEAARGETIEISRRQENRGRVRIRTRDGLETLERSGAIDQTQYKAGLLYRDLYEATDPERDLRSHLEGLERRGRGGEAAAEAWAERRLRLARPVAVIEAKVRIADPQRPGRANVARGRGERPQRGSDREWRREPGHLQTRPDHCAGRMRRALLAAVSRFRRGAGSVRPKSAGRPQTGRA
jgi:hypothetical protein